MKEGYKCAVALNDLHIKVNLGVTDSEMRTPQDVLVSFKLFFAKLPSSCESDNIDDTVCYYKISEIIKNFCQEKNFRLLEYMCFQMHKEIRKAIEPSTKLWLKVDKCNPPVDDLKGTTSFEYGDL